MNGWTSITTAILMWWNGSIATTWKSWLNHGPKNDNCVRKMHSTRQKGVVCVCVWIGIGHVMPSIFTYVWRQWTSISIHFPTMLLSSMWSDGSMASKHHYQMGIYCGQQIISPEVPQAPKFSNMKRERTWREQPNLPQAKQSMKYYEMM